MHYVKHFKINGVDTKQVACIELPSKPNAATEGSVGLLGIDMSSPTHDVYKCVAVNGSIYTWELLSSGLSTIAATITGNGEELVQFPYDTLKIPSGYVMKVGDLIIDSDCYLYQVDAIDVGVCRATYCDVAFTKGVPGDKGEPGAPPFIGENGNWWVGDTDTGVCADMTDYQIPWNVDEETASIVLTPHNATSGILIMGSSTGLKPNETFEKLETVTGRSGYETTRFTHRLPMINNGTVYLHMEMVTDRRYAPISANVDSNYAEVKIYSGDNVVYENKQPLSYSALSVFDNEDKYFKIDVVKGKDIRIEVTQRRYYEDITSYYAYGIDEINNLYLVANKSTAYKYFSLIDSDEPSINDIIDTLLGV